MFVQTIQKVQPPIEWFYKMFVNDSWCPVRPVPHWASQLQPWDLPEALANVVSQGSFRGMANPHDVISLIKKHICDKELSQPPMLVLTNHRAGCLGMVPTEKLPSAQFDPMVFNVFTMVWCKEFSIFRMLFHHILHLLSQFFWSNQGSPVISSGFSLLFETVNHDYRDWFGLVFFWWYQKKSKRYQWYPHFSCWWGGPTTTMHHGHLRYLSLLMQFSSTMATSMTELLPICGAWQPTAFGLMLSFQTFRFTTSSHSLKAWGLRGMFFTSECWMHWRQLSP